MADLFRKYKSLYSSTANSFSTGSGVTITPASVVGLPTDTEITLTFDRVDSSGTPTPSSNERIIGTISGSNFVTRTAPSSGRGADSTTEQAHTSPVVEMIWNSKDWNDAIDGFLTEHGQDGTHDTSVVATLTATQTLTNKTLTSPVINTGISGTAIVDEDDMASDSATKVPTQQSVKAYVDASGSTDGWLSISDTLTYASATSFTISGVDRTSVFTKGTRIKLTQTSAKYFVVTSSSFSTNTTVTITGGTDYTLANAAITSPYYSYQASPQGYPTWFSYTPTFSGFSSSPTVGQARFKVDGASCTLVIHQSANGTSNATTFTITAPIAHAYNGFQILTAAAALDNGSQGSAAPYVLFTGNTSTIEVYKDMTAAAWTASGGKRLTALSGIYRI